MGRDREELKFIGYAGTIALSEFTASFDDDRDSKAVDLLWREYCEEGKPDKDAWLRERLETMFACVGPRPQWIESSPMWPFVDGRPMTFIGQMPVDADDISERYLAPDVVLYTFGIRVPVEDVEGGWQVHYKVVEQHHSLP
jgi:hypothetical protein